MALIMKLKDIKWENGKRYVDMSPSHNVWIVDKFDLVRLDGVRIDTIFTNKELETLDFVEITDYQSL